MRMQACNQGFQMAVKMLLEENFLYTSDVEHWLRANLCTHPDDLAYASKGNSGLLEKAPFLAAAWALAARDRSDDVDMAVRIQEMRYQVQTFILLEPH